MTGPFVPVAMLNLIRAVLGIHHHRFNLSVKRSSANGWEPHAKSNAGRPGAVPRGTLSMFVRFNQNGGG